ncbi:arabinosyltransferase domain-containing protein [Pseudonocardia saturnea]
MTLAVEPVPAGTSTAPRRWRRSVGAAAAALVAVLGAALLPFAPVVVDEPTVSWPRDPVVVESTLLTLTAYRPLAMDVRFSCDVVRAAQVSGAGVVVSTALPESPQAGTTGLIAQAVDGRLLVRGLDRVLVDEPVPAGSCTYRITGRSAGLPSYVAQPPGLIGTVDPAVPLPAASPDRSAFAGPDDAELTVARDGVPLAHATAEQLPDVDALVSSLTELPAGSAGQLAVELRVDDEFTSSPAPLKTALTVVVVLALLATAVLLARSDRRAARDPRPPPRFRLRAVDVLVPAVLAVWAVVAPATDDDGYFTAQARNAVLSGEVGNYYQFYDQSFTPFTWPYQCLAWWLQLAGDAPLVLRLPALACGLLTWLVLRRIAVAALDGWTSGPAPAAVRGVLAVVFLAWWLPYDMGVRPEAMVALCGAAALLAVLHAWRRRRLVAAWAAFAVAGAGFTAHTTGFTLPAVLLAGLPLLHRLVRVGGDPWATALRWVAVASGGAVAPLLGFADGALRDFRRGQAAFLSVLGQAGWSDEIERYVFLLDRIPMGNFAKRAAVLACLVALAWFAVLAVAARVRRVPVPVPLWLAGSATALSFVALWLTPSKWTHHFGALAGVGSVFLALALVGAVPLARAVRLRPSAGLVLAVGASFAVVLALAWQGPNSWAYAWLEGVRTPYEPPSVRTVTLGDPLLWAAAVGVVALGTALRGRRDGPLDLGAHVLRAVPVVVVASLAATSAYAVGVFGAAAVQGVPRESVWARTLADPAGTGCGAAGAVSVLDPYTARPLPPAPDLPVPEVGAGFVEGGGFYAGSRPQGAAAGRVWGSLVAADGRPAERTVGETATAWFTLPAVLDGDSALTVLAAGTLAEGTALTAVYADAAGRPVFSEALADGVRSPHWRTLRLAPPPGAATVRLEAVDATGAAHGWLAFGVPAVARAVLLRDLLPADAPVALGWQLAFGYPCQRQPAVLNGITEPPAYAVLRAEAPLGGLDDIAWQPGRGGVFGQVPRSRSVLQLATVGPVDPYIQVYALGTELRRDAYSVTTRPRTVGGAAR